VCVVASATRIGAHLRICTHDEQKGAARRMRVRDALRTERRHRLPMLMMIVLASARAEGDSRAAAAEAPERRRTKMRKSLRDLASSAEICADCRGNIHTSRTHKAVLAMAAVERAVVAVAVSGSVALSAARVERGVCWMRASRADVSLSAEAAVVHAAAPPAIDARVARRAAGVEGRVGRVGASRSNEALAAPARAIRSRLAVASTIHQSAAAITALNTVVTKVVTTIHGASSAAASEDDTVRSELNSATMTPCVWPAVAVVAAVCGRVALSPARGLVRVPQAFSRGRSALLALRPRLALSKVEARVVAARRPRWHGDAAVGARKTRPALAEPAVRRLLRRPAPWLAVLLPLVNRLCRVEKHTALRLLRGETSTLD